MYAKVLFKLSFVYPLDTEVRFSMGTYTLSHYIFDPSWRKKKIGIN